MQKSQHTEQYRRLMLELKVARVRTGMTQVEASKKLKSYKTYISKVEAGERKIDLIELSEICQLYGITVGELLKTVGIE